MDDDSDDDMMHPDTIHLTMSGGKTSVVGGRKSGSKNYNGQEHRYFLYLVDRLQAWVEGPTGEAWAEISHRLHKRMGFRRDPPVLHDHFMEMVNVTRTVMRENNLLFPPLPENSMNPDVEQAQVDSAYIELGEQCYLGFQNRTGKRLCPSAWWDSEIFAGVARLTGELETHASGVLQHDPSFLEQRRKELDYEEKSHESSLYGTRLSMGGEGEGSVSSGLAVGRKSLLPPFSPAPTGSSLKDDLAEIKQSGKMLRKFDERLAKVEEKIDAILKHLNLPI